ncbi:hypothetical protein [Hymenobacter guriensis]|uniref:Uncharacterized protein n=1 Tax=Hymenobacter guriensis TaxID=2793065 RepID=A0ABS0L7H9_9BACT|nr:hypothetical protein [Hymenobacter guriensis]MBG8556103.1 hypothetical protein [Hymenobacter guriensis]
MQPFLIDTNVGVVANNGHAGASPACVQRAIARLQQFMAGEILVLDEGWEILTEYQRNLTPKTGARAGHLFLRWVYNNRSNTERCHWVNLPRTPEGQYEAYPDQDPALMTFNQSDRVFVAAHLTHPQRPPIVNATDSDWQESLAALSRHGVIVEELCG